MSGVILNLILMNKIFYVSNNKPAWTADMRDEQPLLVLPAALLTPGRHTEYSPVYCDSLQPDGRKLPF